MKKKAITFILLLFFNVVFILPNSNASKKIVITVFDAEKYDVDLLNQILTDYSKMRNINLTIEYLDKHAAMPRTYAQLAAGSTHPDLILGIWHDDLPALISGNFIEPLDDYISSEEKIVFLKPSIDAMTFGNRLYGIPMSLDTQILIYNKRILPKPPKSWKELEYQAKRIRSQGNEGLLFNAQNFISIWPFISAFGMNTMDIEKEENFLFNRPAIDGLAFIKELSERNIIDLKYSNYFDVRKLFIGGKAGMIIDGSWSLYSFKKEGVDWGAQKIPPLPEGNIPRPFVFVSGIVVNKYSENKKIAIDFIKYISQERNLERLWAQKYWVPANANLIEKLRKTEKDLPAMIILEQCQLGELFPKTAKIGAMLGPSNDALADVFLRNKDIETTLKSVEKAILWKKPKK